ncbi:MAG: hypothetical protein PHP50_14310 [Lachnospiraceae bacterium]|nr:hypothetical protein [Lachnospiraceae bacterium]
MDNFMDKIAQKFYAQEMIKANSAADAAEMAKLQKQISEYDVCLQEMRKLNFQNTEAMQKIQRLLDESLARIEGTTPMMKETDNGVTKEQIEAIQTGVQESLQESIETLKEQLTAISNQNNDYVHKENVKVYRNVQAAMVEELDKQGKSLVSAQSEQQENLFREISGIQGKLTATLVIAIFAMLASFGGIAISVCQMLGIL